MSIEEENKAIEKRYIEEIWNKGNVALTGEFLTANYAWHGPGGREVKGIDGIKQLATGLHSTFPNLTFKIEDMVAEGKIIMYRYTARGTFSGNFMGVAPTGKKVIWTGFMQDNFKENRIVESWERADMLDLYQQMGIKPPKR